MSKRCTEHVMFESLKAHKCIEKTSHAAGFFYSRQLPCLRVLVPGAGLEPARRLTDKGF